MTTPQGSGRTCMFCERRQNLTREHIFSGWISEELRTGRPDSFRFETERQWQGPQIDTEVWRYRTKLIEVKVKGVCEPCNSGWMNRIEEAARPIMVPLIRGTARSLTLPDQAILASWVTLKMIVLDYSMTEERRPYGRFFSDTEAHRFYQDKSRQPKDSTVLFVARHVGTLEGWAGWMDFGWDHSSGKTVRAGTGLLLVGELVFVMLGHRITPDIVGPNLVGFDVQHLNTTGYPIHPPMQKFPWPPPAFIKDEELWDVLERWRLNPPKTQRLGESGT